ncbi:uncharacterized protein LOC139914509 [Centroberyx gerrardi]
MREGQDTDWWYKINKDGQQFVGFSEHKRYTLQPLATARRPKATLSADKTAIPVGGSVTLTCSVQESSSWKYYWYRKEKDSEPLTTEDDDPNSNKISVSQEGLYWCRGARGDSVYYTESSLISFCHTVKPKATLSAYPTAIPAGGRVTLTCSVEGSSDWKYYWYRQTTDSDTLIMEDGVTNLNRAISVSDGGLYWCRGGRGEPIFFTQDSDAISINRIVSDRAVVTLQPNWPQIYNGETITLRCEIQGGDTEWEYEWRTTNSYKPPKQNEYRISSAYSYHSGDYECKGRQRSGQQSSTEWSSAFKLTVKSYKPTPVLTVSPVWLSPGASVTLSCEVEGSSAGWRFYWYKAVPKLSDNSYTYELLPGSNDGTAEGSYILHGPTHTGGYMCRAGRGDPVFYTHNSEPKFILSGDRRSSASVTVSPNRTQHFSSESVSLSCEGNSTEWTVKRFTEEGYLTHCSSNWGSMTGSKCNIDSIWTSAVYWCESGSGEFSNAVNITGQYGSLILLSPVHPVTEGDSVTLGCKSRTEPLRYNVDFYRNDKLIQNETTGEMTIHAVSKSDEGFYKCKYSRTESPQSWMAVKFAASRPASSSFPVWLIIGLVTVILLIILLLLLCCYRKSKDPCCGRPIQSQSTNQGSTTDQREDQENGRTPLHGDAYVYESIKGSEDTENGGPADESNDITYSSIELKNVHKKVKHVDPAESSVYSDVKIGSTTEESNVTSAQVYHQNKGKAKDNKEVLSSLCIGSGKVCQKQSDRVAELDVRMGRTSLCVLVLFLLSTLLYHGHAQDAVLTLEPNRSHVFTGESVTFICDMREIKDTDWWYKINKDAVKPKATLSAYPTIPVGSSVTLTCSVEGSSDWKYYWYRQTTDSGLLIMEDGVPNLNRDISVSDGGLYWCRGGRGHPIFFTQDSDAITIDKIVGDRPVVTLQPNWPQIYSGETITLRCEIQGGGDTDWEYEWRTSSSNKPLKQAAYRIVRASESDRGDYSCKGRQRSDLYSSTEWSNTIRLTVSRRPKAKLSADKTAIPVGGSVTLTCSVQESSGWKYYWYRKEKDSEPLTTEDDDPNSNKISVSQEGLYWCRGVRGDSVYYTENSDSIRIDKNVANRAVVTLQPNWPQIYSGETITLRCEIEGGGDTDWEYEWRTSNSYKPQKQNEYRISSAYSYHSGDYECKGRQRNGQQSSTEWSSAFKLTVSYKPTPVLTVSPVWLSPGASVTLSCEVEGSSAGWRFYWYKAVPKLSDNSYTYELLPGSNDGTAEGSYILHGPTHTGGYMCRAGRGDPVFYTHNSKPKFIWSGDRRSSASVTVSPNRTQHFSSESVSLSCEGNSTEWRVKRFTERGHLTHCSSNWGSMTGSKCNIVDNIWTSAVYWCESGSGEFSNAVNITGHSGSLILLSPVHPVTEGDSVTLGCKSRTEPLLSNVDFYRNDKLIQNKTTGEMTIHAVSKSDEGFYKCKYSRTESPQSWMAVKFAVSRPASSSFPVWLIIGLVTVILLIILLLLLCLCRKYKDPCCGRPIQSQSTNQGSTTDQREHQENAYSALLHGDADVYETIKASEDTQNGGPAGESSDITFSSIELRNVHKKGEYTNYKHEMNTEQPTMPKCT